MPSRIVFRGSASAPDQKFKDGFTPRNARDEIQIQPGGQMIGGVSMSKDLGTALRYAANYDGWVYVAYIEDGIDVLEYITAKSKKFFGGEEWKKGIPNAVTQAEIAVVKIAPTQIIAARQCRKNGNLAEMYGKVHYNWLCVVPGTQALQGARWLETSFSVSAEYEK
jgi:hypothetical protein